MSKSSIMDGIKCDVILRKVIFKFLVFSILVNIFVFEEYIISRC